MVRILHVLGGLNRGGAESMVMNLYRAVDRTKIQFDFIVHTDTHQDYTDEILSLGGKIYSFPKYRVYNGLKLTRIWNNFFKEHPEYKILHSHVRSYASIYLPIAKKHGLTTIIHSHSTSNGKGLASIVKRILQSSLKRRADYLFACSEEAGEWLYGSEAIKKENYRMIPNAVDTAKFCYNEQVRREKRKELGIPDGVVVYGHVGRLHPAKNHMFLLDAFSETLKSRPDSILLIVGDGELRGDIEAKIRELGISDNVKMLGSRGDVADLLQAMDVFVFPSRWEGLPVTVVEAQAAGLPCLVSETVTRDVAVSHLVRYIPIDSGVDAWVREMLSLEFARDNVIDEIKNAGFDINAAAEKLTEFYSEL